MAKRIRGAQGVTLPNVATERALFAGGSGRWATQQLKAAIMAGKPLSADALRTADTLRHEEWKYFDNVVQEEALIRLVGVADLVTAGLVRPVPNSLGKTVFASERVTYMDPAEVSLDGLSRTDNDVQEFDLVQSPLPITHKDFFINLRTLAASRQMGEPLDTLKVRTAGRVVAEAAEKMLFQGGKTFGGMTIYGYTTFTDRLKSTFDGGKSWDDATKAGTSYLADAQTALTALAAKRMYGPFMIYVPTDASVRLESDFNPGTSDTRSIRQRLLQLDQVAGVKVADQMPTGHVVFVQMTADVIEWVQGETLQVIQWDEYGGFQINFKAFQIAIPLPHSDAQGRCGIYDFHKP